MRKIAVLLTCHNRSVKTLSCLANLFKANKLYSSNLSLCVYLTDDGSSDGTSDIVKKTYPLVTILKGSGNLFWARGMINSWKEALKNEYDAYLLLNDDTNVSINLFPELLKCHDYSLANYNTGGIYIGATHDGKYRFTYGGALIKSKFLFTYTHLVPNGEIKECDYGNGNIMLVDKSVVSKIGILKEVYTHGIADFDYTLTARKKQIPVLITSDYCGECSNYKNNKFDLLKNLKFIERFRFIISPLGFGFHNHLIFNIKFFPYRVPLLYLTMLTKLLFPKLYLWMNTLR